ncbi:MAG: sigma-70 family RNA polymerase sigma factor [Anaerolineales bacterium]|nr:sigma-70 family RNA polymerase sigma factor [Anaerolineales bacterium]
MTRSEKQLIRQAKKFDREALAEIYDQYSDALFNYAVRRVGSPQQAEDFVAETFERFLNALERGGGPEDHLQAYLYRITHNLITDLYRREPPPPLQLEEDRIQGSEKGPGQVFTERSQAERIRQALHLLTPGQQQVIILKYLQGLSNQEVARAMDKSVGSIKAQAHRGLAALERILVSDEGENLPETRE